MFNTEQLMQIISQLQNASGLNYFEVLLLILTLIGLCAGPILIFILIVGLFYWIPKLVMRKRVPIPKGMKLYIIEIALKSNNKRLKLDYTYRGSLSIHTNRTEQFLHLLEARGKVRFKTIGLLLPFTLLLLSPFFFIHWALSVILITVAVLLIIGFIIDYYYNNYAYFGDDNSFYDSEKQDRDIVSKKIESEIEALNAKNQIMTAKELEQYLNSKLEVTPYIVRVSDKTKGKKL